MLSEPKPCPKCGNKAEYLSYFKANYCKQCDFMFRGEPKLCPKCGSLPVIEQGDDLRYRVKCQWDAICKHTTDWHSTEDEAIAEWNRNNSMPYS